MRLRKFFSCCIALLLCLAISAPAFSAPLTKVRTAWMDEFEAFPIWYAKEKGWDKEAGLDLEILYFTSGMAILNALPSGEWQYAAIGAVPARWGLSVTTRMSLPMPMRNSSSTASSSGPTAPSPR